ncbi:uncharacterized protein EI90DRAFT_3249388, partial [Cantharellus anzutake]|uniref:uncharacterized protein n=1 Tax=Cantharellus anzutake TaxID=1750568 RepID=UPI001907C8A1
GPIAIVHQGELENVTDLQPGSDSFEYFFKIQCSSCHEVHSKLVSLNRKTILDMPTTKSTKTNFYGAVIFVTPILRDIRYRIRRQAICSLEDGGEGGNPY